MTDLIILTHPEIRKLHEDLDHVVFTNKSKLTLFNFYLENRHIDKARDLLMTEFDAALKLVMWELSYQTIVHLDALRAIARRCAHCHILLRAVIQEIYYVNKYYNN